MPTFAFYLLDRASAHPPSSEVGMLTFNGKTIKKNLKWASRSMKQFRPQLSLWLVKQTLLMSTAVNKHHAPKIILLSISVLIECLIRLSFLSIHLQKELSASVVKAKLYSIYKIIML